MRIPPWLAQASPQSGLGQRMIALPPFPMENLSVHPISYEAVSLIQISSYVSVHSQNSVSKSNSIQRGKMGHYRYPQTQSVMSTLNPLIATSVYPSICSPGYQIPLPGTMGGAGRGSGKAQYHSMLRSAHAVPTTSNQFQISLPPNSVNNLFSHILQLNPAPTLQIMAVSHSIPAHTNILGEELDLLLLNPPLHSTTTFHPLVPPMQTPPPPLNSLILHI